MRIIRALDDRIMNAPRYRKEAEMAFSDLSMDFLEEQKRLTPGDVPGLEYALFWYSAKTKWSHNQYILGQRRY